MTVRRLMSNESHGSQFTVCEVRGRSAIVHVEPPSNDVATWIVCLGQTSFSEAVTMWSGSRGSTAMAGSSVGFAYSSGQSRVTFASVEAGSTHSTPDLTK